ncbi:hypothetical protein KA344_08495 [bacterium]|jgi:hypothetical protein|nr:hypothetical protein [bacterium]
MAGDIDHDKAASDQSEQPRLDLVSLAGPVAKTDLAKTDLATSVVASEKNFKVSLAQQGLVGQLFDELKNNFGGSSKSDSWLERKWSTVLDSGLGSEAVGRQLAAAKPLFSSDGKGNLVLSASQAAKDFDRSQETGKYVIGGAAIALSATLLLRGRVGKLFQGAEGAAEGKSLSAGVERAFWGESKAVTGDFVQLSKERLFHSPLNELQATAEHNMKGLLARVEQAGESMPRLAFHGGPPERAKIVEDFYLHGKDYEMPLYVASPMKRAEDASSRLADVMSSFKHASGYAGTPATGKLFAFDASGADMSGMYIKGRPAELPSLFARSEHAGEKVMGLDHDLKLLKVFEADELRYTQPPTDLPDYFKRLPYLEQLETQRQAHALLQAIGL